MRSKVDEMASLI